MQRVPKKTNVVKSDLLNSTARLWKQNASATKLNNHPYITPPRGRSFDSRACSSYAQDDHVEEWISPGLYPFDYDGFTLFHPPLRVTAFLRFFPYIMSIGGHLL